MADFAQAIEYVLANEGGIVNDANDPGGLTNFGLSQRSYPALDLRSITRDDAIAIYRRDYWKFEEVQSQRVATKILDAYVNMEHGGIRCLQLALNINADGAWGPDTLAHVNAANEDSLMNEFKARLAKFYCDEVIANPHMSNDLLGWLRRAVKG